MFFRFETMQCRRTFTKRFTHSTQKEIVPFYGKMHFVGSSSQAFWDKLHKIDYLQIFQAGYFFTKKQIAAVFNKTTIMPLVYQHDLPASFRKKSCKRLRSRSKQTNALSINPCACLYWLFHGERSSTLSGQAFSLTLTMDFSHLSCFFLHSRL